MTLGKRSKKKIQIGLLRTANEHFQHRRHHVARKKKSENNIEKRKKLEELKLTEIEKEMNKIL